MKSFLRLMGTFFAVAIFFAHSAIAGNIGGSGHGGHVNSGGGSDSHGGHFGGESSQTLKGEYRSSDHNMHSSNAKGKMIHHSNVDGFELSYELIDMREQMRDLPNMPEMTETHHLMVYVEGLGDAAFENAKAGYLIIGPDGEKQRVMGTGMGGGFGADVNFGEKGDYTIKTKIVTANEKLMDSFTHRVD